MVGLLGEGTKLPCWSLHWPKPVDGVVFQVVVVRDTQAEVYAQIMEAAAGHYNSACVVGVVVESSPVVTKAAEKDMRTGLKFIFFIFRPFLMLYLLDLASLLATSSWDYLKLCFTWLGV